MIAFEELSAALDRWRIRNGLPVVGGDVPSAPVAAMPTPAPAPWSPAPAAAPRRDPEGSDVVSLGDDELVEDEYDADGADYAMGFGGAPAPLSDPGEATASGPVPTSSAPAMPQYADDPYGSGPYGQQGYAQGGDPAYDDAAYQGYAQPGVDTMDAEVEAEPLDDATVVGDERPKH